MLPHSNSVSSYAFTASFIAIFTWGKDEKSIQTLAI